MKTIEDAKEYVVGILISNLTTLNRTQHRDLHNPHFIQEYVIRMDEAHRFYHTWIHICRMLSAAYSVFNSTEGTVRVESELRLLAAILFHDIVCVPGAKDNEDQSVEFASRFYQADNLPQIRTLIMATAHTFPFVRYDDDRDILCDLDLMILGSCEDDFSQYRKDIASEYLSQGFTLDQINMGTQKFFDDLLRQAGRSFIYRNSYFESLYREQALQNIKRILGM